jgi:hypothetical protein
MSIPAESDRAASLEAALSDLFSSLVAEGVLTLAAGDGPGHKKKRPVRKVVCTLKRRRVKRNGSVECLYLCTNGKWITRLRSRDKPCEKQFSYNVPA